ncbi:MAG: hypothetical protein KGJ23_13960 [Euryarchaeota archaeon]|nr:hypothetical protein [Euryarchaeota archaeon]MDE1837703.1 hypothetical protein [Euryarchaeota archaeon]MDE1881738.1 hypothetical protein [Euryarchaeota archaeon]MDE2045967.1 hypothetical protein [Thermoplasmata archaeon]
MTNGVGAGDGSDAPISRTDEWKEARNVIDTVDGQIASLRQYGLSFVAGLLAAQGLIEFPLSSASAIVPDSVKLGILIASFALILGIFDLDRKARDVQRAAAHRACMLEGKYGLTKLISASYGSNDVVTSADVLYLIFVFGTTVLGFAVLGLTTLNTDYRLTSLIASAAVTGGAVYVFGHAHPRWRRK